MQLASIPFDEAQRLNALHRLRILDSEPEERFDRITRIAHYLFDIPYVLITLVDTDRVWFKSKYGYDINEVPRNLSFCGHTICNTVSDELSSRILEVSDTEKDTRFHDNPSVTKKSGTKYYMGFILQSTDHHNVGTFGMYDSRPRTFSAMDKKLFSDLGLMAEAELNSNRHDSQIGISNFISHASSEDGVTGEHSDKLLTLSVKLETVEKHFNDSLKMKGINYKEWRVLNEIVQIEFASPHLISQKLGITPPLMTRRLDALEIKRLIERWNSKDGDRRFVHLACSKRGKEVWSAGIDEINRLSEIHLENFICLK